jgi:hypothetical protein
MHIDMATPVTFVIARYGRKKRQMDEIPFLNGKSVLSKRNFRLNTSRLTTRLAALYYSPHPNGHRLPRWKESRRRELRLSWLT